MRKISYILNVVITTYILLVLAGCESRQSRLEEQISAVTIQLEVIRFDRLFAQAGDTGLAGLMERYPYMFPGPDSIWSAKLQDSLQLEIQQQVDSVFGDFGSDRKRIESLYRHIRYYFPDMPLPSLMTVTSDVQYRSRVLWTDSLALVGLDNYLGPGHRFYQSFPRYLRAELDRDYLTTDLAWEFGRRVTAPPLGREFLDKMIYHGKVAYLAELLNPDLPEGMVLHYSPEQWEWAEANEEQIWVYFRDGGRLFSTDSRLERDFIGPAPFSKFGLALDGESPPRIGQYLGYKIVRAFAQRTNAEIGPLLSIDARTLFNQSNYKPQKR